MGHFLPALTEHKIRVQKDVIKNEYRQNVANRPYGMVWRLLAEAMYPPNHPYSWTTIGVMEDVEAATLDDVEAFFRRFYVPGNASLAIVGDIDEDRALGMAERYFGTLPGGTQSLRPWASRAAARRRVAHLGPRPGRARPPVPDLAHRPRSSALTTPRWSCSATSSAAASRAGCSASSWSSRAWRRTSAPISRAASWPARSGSTPPCARGPRSPAARAIIHAELAAIAEHGR